MPESPPVINYPTINTKKNRGRNYHEMGRNSKKKWNIFDCDGDDIGNFDVSDDEGGIQNEINNPIKR